MVDLNKLRVGLEIRVDGEDLDDCLIEQPDLFYQTASGYEHAVAERDSAKLELEEATAEADLQLRRKAYDNDEKITETALGHRIAVLPKIKEAQRSFLDAKAKVGEWSALKEAFQQRSYMLREIVARQIAMMGDLSIEKGSHGVHNTLKNARADTATRLRGQEAEKNGQRERIRR
jgi:hypothetical protein